MNKENTLMQLLNMSKKNLINPYLCKVEVPPQTPHYSVLPLQKDDGLCDAVGEIYTNNQAVQPKPM